MPNTDSPQVLITPLKPALILGMAQKLPILIRVQTPRRAAFWEAGTQTLPSGARHRPLGLHVGAAVAGSRALRPAHR